MARDYMNFYRTQLTADVLVGDDTLSVGTLPDALATGDYFRLRMYAVDEDGAVIKSEFVDWQSDGTVARAAEGSTEQAFDQGDWLEIVDTAKSYTEVDGALLISYREKTGPTTTSGVISMADGPIQPLDLIANTTLSFPDITDGQNITLHVTGLDSGWTLAFPAGAKVGTLPDLSTAVEAVFAVWMVGAQIYAVFVEEFS